MKFNFKKIASVFSSAVMVGSTVALAAAANFPAPFVQNGAGNVAIVYGTSGAATTDLVAVADIQTALSEELAKETATGSSASSATVSGGDSYKIEKTSTKFHIGRGIIDVVSGSVTDDNLPTLLADGVFTDDDNDEFDFTQKIALYNHSVTMFEDNDYKADEPSLGMRIASGAHVLNYTMDFTDEPLWADLETTDLTIMGKTYYVLDAVTNTSLTLLDSAETANIAEGETKTLTVGDKSYAVKINFVGDNKVKLDVNGAITTQLAASGTYKLTDGTYVGIKEINYNSKDAGVSNVEFSLGKGKLKLSDAAEVELNDDAVSDLTVDLTSSTEKLQSIKLIWVAEDDLFVTEDSSATMPGFGVIKLTSGGISFASDEAIAVEPDGDDSFVLKSFPFKDSTEDVNLLYFDGTNFTYVGEDSTKQLRTSATTSITFDGDTDAQAIVSWTDGDDAESYLIKATNFANKDDGTNKTTIQYRKDGVWVDAKTDAELADVVSIGNVDLTVGAIEKAQKTVVLTDTAATFNTLYSKDGLKVYLPYTNSTATNLGAVTQYASASAACTGRGVNLGELYLGKVGYNDTTTDGMLNTTIGDCALSFALKFTEEDKDGNKAAGQNITLTLADNTNDDTSITAVSLTSGGSSTEIGSTDVERNFVYSALATEVKFDKSGDQQKVALTYHGDESFANIFLTAPAATVSAAGTASGASVTSLGSVIYKDTEVASVSKNLIVVGGSCVNSVAQSLLGSAKPLCGADFTTKTTVGAGQFLIQTFAQTGGKIATLVAGYNAADTTAAAKYLTTSKPVIDATQAALIKTSSTVNSLV